MTAQKTPELSLEERLQAPFNADDIEWRIQQAGISGNGNNGNGKPWVRVIPYITNRAVQKRLDEVFGTMGWEDEFKELADNSGFLCGISVYIDGKKITKWDGAEKTNIEPVKGGLSDSQKRAAVKLGIGRYLYKLDAAFADCRIVNSRYEADRYHQDAKTKTHISWSAPILPIWALPITDYSELISPIEKAQSMPELFDAFKEAWKASEVSLDKGLEKAAIKAKDKRKAEITKHQSKIEAGKIQKLTDWVNIEISTFNELPTKSTVENFAEKIKESLENKTKGETFDKTGLVAIITESCEARVNEIKSAQEAGAKKQIEQFHKQ